jgi:hypothetical protein
VEGICKKRLRLRIERIDRDRAITSSFDEDRSLEDTQNEKRPTVDASKPHRDGDPAEYK